MTGGLLSALFSGMWHGYRRWMTLFNSLSIVLSVTLAMVILSFTHGVRRYVDDMVRKEAAAGAVRVHAGGWQLDRDDETFALRARRADDAFQAAAGEAYLGFNFWWRSEAHYLMPEHPDRSRLGGVFVKMGNTYPEDPEAGRVAAYAVAGGWVSDAEARELVLDNSAAVKLAKRMEDLSSVGELIGREVWITLPGTRDHLPAACAQVKVVGIFKHLRDGACMTTPRVVQDMHARTQANANGRWYETYDRMAYRVVGVGQAADAVDPEQRTLARRLAEDGPVPLICWRSRNDAERWVSVRGRLARRGSDEVTRGLRAAAGEAQADLERALATKLEADRAVEDLKLLLQGSAATRQWLAELDAAAQAAFADVEAPEAAHRLHDMARVAVEHLALDLDPDGLTSPEAYAAFHAAVTNRIAATARELQLEMEARVALAEAAANVAAETRARHDELNREATAAQSDSILPREGILALQVVDEDSGEPVRMESALRWDLPASEYTDAADLDRMYPEGYVLCSPRVWDELGYAAAPLREVDGWREHALYAYFYFDGLRPALEAREQLKTWGFETYMPIDRFKGLLALVRVVTWAALALLAAVLLAGLLGIVVTLYTEVDAEEAEIGLLKALGASNRLVGLVFLCKGALVGLVGVVIGVPLAGLVTSRINAGVSGAVARAAGIADVDTGLFSQDPRLVLTVAVMIVALAALAALMPALQAAARDPQEALRAE